MAMNEEPRWSGSRTWAWARVCACQSLACAWLVLAAPAAQADEFSVGRVDVEFADEGWREVTLPDRSIAYSGGKTGALTVTSKLFARGVPGSDTQVLVVVSANSRGMGGGRAGYMAYGVDCKSDANLYREGNEGVSAPFMQCLTVIPSYNSESVLKALAPEVLELQNAGEWVNPLLPVYTVWSRHAISTGSFVDVRVFVVSPLSADVASLAEPVVQLVPPEHVVWGRQLKDAVKSAVYSLTGRLVVPPIQLKQRARSLPLEVTEPLALHTSTLLM